jgi:hypothetical protein
MASRYEVGDYMNHYVHSLIVCFPVTLQVSASKLIYYSHNIRKEIERTDSYLIHIQIINSDVDTAFRNSNSTKNSCVLTLSRLALQLAEKMPCTLLHAAHSYTPHTLNPFPYSTYRSFLDFTVLPVLGPHKSQSSS